MKNYKEFHTFVICAYKENKYLEQCINSVLNQTFRSNVLISTSTPNGYISGLAQKYSIPVVVNESPKNAGTDWNYGYMSAATPYVTIVHQDDLYEKDYTELVLKELLNNPNALLAYTDYYELRETGIVTSNKILRVKRILNFPLSFRAFSRNRTIRLRLLGFGCAICCPSVTYNRKLCGDNIFDTNYINSCDYKTFVDLARREGQFIYVNNRLVGHRIYAESATSKNIALNIRANEDQEILETLWPRSIAKIINSVYRTSEKSNDD